jgi:hypothetical protein
LYARSARERSGAGAAASRRTSFVASVPVIFVPAAEPVAAIAVSPFVGVPSSTVPSRAIATARPPISIDPIGS